MRARLTIALTLALLAQAGTARADIIVLINHVMYSGIIVSESKDAVVILADGEEHKFWRDMIASLKYDKLTAEAERQRDKRNEDADLKQSPVKITPGIASLTATNSGSAVLPDSDGVTLYGTPWCGYCKLARALLHRHNVPFTDRDVDSDKDAQREMVQKCNAAGVQASGVPVIDVFGTMMTGYNARELTALLRKHGY